MNAKIYTKWNDCKTTKPNDGQMVYVITRSGTLMTYFYTDNCGFKFASYDEENICLYWCNLYDILGGVEL